MFKSYGHGILSEANGVALEAELTKKGDIVFIRCDVTKEVEVKVYFFTTSTLFAKIKITEVLYMSLFVSHI